MKKIICLLLALVMCASVLVACGETENEPADNGTSNQNPQTPPAMTYDEYVAAELDSKVVVETYVQAKQSWWFNSEKNTGLGTFYMQSPDGAYYVYEMPCTEEEYNSLTVGTKVRIEGYKAEWSGEVEIIEATFKILEGSYIAEPIDLTATLGKDDLVSYQNQKVSFGAMVIVPSNENGDAFLYKYNGSGKEGDDIYFRATVCGEVYTFVIESYLCDKTTDVYKAAQSLKVGDVVDLEGFLYWYDGPQPHITSIKNTDVLSNAEYDAADKDDLVVVRTFVQGKQSWWFNSDKNTGLGTFYMQSTDGAYFVYELPITQEVYNNLVPGTGVIIRGYKAEWSGEVEIVDATYAIPPSDITYIADAFDATALLGTAELVDHQNEKVAFKGLTVVPSNDAGDAFLYKWNGTGKEGDDIYFKASIGGATYTFVIESYLCDKTTDVYKAAQALKVGDVIDLEGFLYWYDGAQPHITSIVVK